MVDRTRVQMEFRRQFPLVGWLFGIKTFHQFHREKDCILSARFECVKDWCYRSIQRTTAVFLQTFVAGNLSPLSRSEAFGQQSSGRWTTFPILPLARCGKVIPRSVPLFRTNPKTNNFKGKNPHSPHFFFFFSFLCWPRIGLGDSVISGHRLNTGLIDPNEHNANLTMASCEKSPKTTKKWDSKWRLKRPKSTSCWVWLGTTFF